MTNIPKPFQPVVNEPVVKRNPEHWPASVQEFLTLGYGGEQQRLSEERRRSPDGSEHMPPGLCYQLAVLWTDKIDAHVSDYFLLPRGSFRDSALDASAKNLKPKDQNR